MTADTLARPEIRRLRRYVSARQEPGTIRLNANESSWTAENGRSASSLNRYPEIRPLLLQSRLARHYGVSPDRLLVTRGSSEAIDLLIRAFCRSSIDNIVVTPPTFSMYRFYADIQGAETVSVPLLADHDFELDVGAVLGACNENSKLICICAPNNPTGGLVDRSRLLDLACARKGKSLVVVDEAYIEFSGSESLTSFAGKYDNLVVLRTLSKALALAGARCGAVVGSARVIDILNGILAPYALATPVIECVLDALAPDQVQTCRDSTDRIIRERNYLADALARQSQVVKVWPSRANFLLVQFRNLAQVQAKLQANHILIRAFDGEPGLANCARITVGTRGENDLLLATLASLKEPG